MAFLEQQYLALEAVNNKKEVNQNQKHINAFNTTQRGCAYCHISGHKVIDCRQLFNLQVAERCTWAEKMKICEICLGHRAEKKCFKFYNKCEKCGGKHHTTLHNVESSKPGPSKTNSRTQITVEGNAVTLLATAQVRVKSACGEQILMRALIDQGSQRTSISEEAAQLLKLPRKKVLTDLIGLGNTTVGRSKATVQIEIKPRFQSDAVHTIEAMVLSTLSSAQPDNNVDIELETWRNYLADPLFYKSDRIDDQIGADLYHQIIQSGVVKIGSLSGQETSLGLIICGSVKGRESGNVVMAVTTELERFWEMEEVIHDDEFQKDKCEQLFTTTTYLNEDNRFVVRLPFKTEANLGESRKMALARLLNLEKRFIRDGMLKEEYLKFMK
ncbi:uncharacterized protein LOC142235406 [Haematobia irritans]|uniref:uncharacterized protein LOC142235406 n=1 Tax=Haematobia irritans TaxID=7368 RepID=UPI003F4F9D20